MIIFIIPKNSGLEFKAEEILKKYNLTGKIIKIRGEDIPCFVSKLSNNNKEVIGITGEDLFKEFILKNRDSNLKIVEKIKWEDDNYLFKKPSLCLLGPKSNNLENLNKKLLKICINSKYKELAKKYILNILENKGYKLEKIYVSGTTEEFFAKGVVDLVIDIVCSGKSAENAGLKVYDKIFESNIVIIGRPDDKKIINFNYKGLDFEKMNNLIPTITKDEQGNVLMLAYSNKESLKKAVKTKEGWYYSRSRNKLWKKGETSGNSQELIKIKTDCDKDSLIFIVKQTGNACHLKRYSCFSEKRKFNLQELYNIISDKIKSNDKNSYTKELVVNPDELKRKLIEEAGEVITSESRENLIWECADLIYFLFVIMAKEGITIEDIEKENKRRNKETLLNKQELNNNKVKEEKYNGKC